MKIDLFKIDQQAGKNWMQLVHEQSVAEKREAIRTKYRRRRRLQQAADRKLIRR